MINNSNAMASRLVQLKRSPLGEQIIVHHHANEFVLPPLPASLPLWLCTLASYFEAQHQRCMVAEVMGRHVGHIATWAGIAGGAALILVPEEPFDVKEVCESILRRHAQGRYATIVVVAVFTRLANGPLLGR